MTPPDMGLWHLQKPVPPIPPIPPIPAIPPIPDVAHQELSREQLRLQIREQVREQIREQLRSQGRMSEEEIEARAEDAAERAADRVERTFDRFGIPGSQPPDMPPWGTQRIPEEAVIISIAFFIMCAVIAIGIPIGRAFGRRVDRRSTQGPPELTARLERIEQAVDAVAIEVERISEGQRYTTKVVSELRALPEPNPLEGRLAAEVVREARGRG